MSKYQKTGQRTRPGNALGNHGQKPLVGMKVLALVPIKTVKTEEGSNQEDDEQNFHLGGVHTATSEVVFISHKN